MVEAWIVLVLCVTTIAVAVFDHVSHKRHRAWMADERQKWVESNDRLLAALREAAGEGESEEKP
jgi:hypothetical protein